MDPELPNHVGIIMDGNRRWAKARGLTPIEGHRAGYQALVSLLPVAQQLKIPYVSVYAFSSENWSRAQAEVAGLMSLVQWVVKNELKKFAKQGIRIKIIGSMEKVPPEVVKALQHAEAATAEGTSLTLGICFNYGGHQEIADAVKAIVDSGIAPDDITPEVISQHVYAPDVPPLDYIIRTSGEQRISGFMLWRSDYAELYFSDLLWPDFDEAEIRKALDSYASRKRRFGT